MALPARIGRHVHKPPPRIREGNSEPHRKLIKQLPCVVCLTPPPNDPHHLQQAAPKGQRGTSLKATDRWSLPACRNHHRWIEKIGNDETQLASIGIDARALCSALWWNTGDLEAMERVVFRFHQASKLYLARQKT